MKMSGLAQQDGHRRRHFPRYGITGSACAPSRNQNPKLQRNTKSISTVRLRGPSNSTKTIRWNSPRPNFPARIGTQSDGPTRALRT